MYITISSTRGRINTEKLRNQIKNILTEGVSLLSSGTGEYTDGDDVRLRNEQLSAKSEAPESLAQG